MATPIVSSKRARQGLPARFQLQSGTRAGHLSVAGAWAFFPPERDAHQPLGQTRLQVDLLERAAQGRPDARRRAQNEPRWKTTACGSLAGRGARLNTATENKAMPQKTINGASLDVNDE